MKIVEVEIEKLIPAPYNPRQMTKEQAKNLTESIRRFGLVDPVIANEFKGRENIIIGGHQRVTIAQQLGIKTVPVFYISLPEEKEKELNIRLNRNVGEWDWDKLANFELDFLKEMGFDDLELAKGLNLQLDVVEDEAPEPRPDPNVKLGDLFQLGNHRLLCGDATKKEDVERLMDGQKADMVLSDPPYNTGMKAKADSTWLSHIFNDSFTPEQFEAVITGSFANMFDSTKGSAVFYVCIDWRNVGYIKDHLEKLMPVKNVIVWDKVVHGLGSDYKFTYEMIVVGKKGEPKIENRIGTDYQDIWRVQRTMGRNEDHATAKPIALLSKPIQHASKDDDIILDLFGGSGSTLIACEQLNRKCYMMEIDHQYVRVIIDRWEKLTGQKASKIDG